MTGEWRRAIVVGASSGIGEAIARQLGASGASLALVSRNGDALARLAREIDEGPGEATVFVHDVRETSEVAGLFQEITRTLGGLELVVYSSGIMPNVAMDAFPTPEDVLTIDTNLSGAVAWLNEAADRFRRAHEGTIIGISSVAGDRGRPANPVYNATKAGMSAYLEALRNRLARHGVTVLTAKPGWVTTPMLGDRQLPRLLPPIDPERAAREILAAAAKGKRVAYIPAWWRVVMAVIRLIPAPLMERMGI